MSTSRIAAAVIATLSAPIAGAVFAASPAAASPGAPAGYCPTTQWQLLTVEFVLQHTTPTGVPSLDGNRDGNTCVLFIDHGRVSIVDNTRQTPPTQ